MPGVIKIGSEFLVNTTTTGAQELPAITGLTNGRFVVTWTDWSQNGADISQAAVRAQLFDADGSKAGDEFLANTTITGIQTLPVVTSLADGRFVIAWQDASRGAGDPSGEAIRAQIFDADGAKSGSEIVVPLSTLNHQAEPTIAGLPGGGFVVAWTDSSGIGDPQASAIRAQIFDEDGAKLFSEFLVNSTTDGSQEQPAIAVLADGRIVATWTDSSMTGADQSGHAIRARLFAADGVPSSLDFVVNTTTLGGQTDPTVTGLTDGRFVVAWADQSSSGGDVNGYAVRAQVFNGDGTKSGSEFLVNTMTIANQYQPSITALPDGRFVAVWTDTSGSTATSFSAHAQVFNGDGTRLGAEFVVNTTDGAAQWRPSITALSDGRFAVAWEDQSATGGDTSSHAVRAQIFDLGEVPVIVSGDGGDTATLSVSENMAAVTTVAATDADSPSLVYSIVGGADAAHFQIDAASGALSFTAAPDFEAANDQGEDNSYVVTVRASDGALSDDQTITVNVTGVNETPVIVSDSNFSVPESGTAVATVEFNDPEAGDTIQFSIVGGADALRFDIDEATGALSFNEMPDFEVWADADHDNSYEVVVRVSDGALSDDQAITVNVANVNETPAILNEGGGGAVSLDADENSEVVAIVQATDPDVGDTIGFSIAGGADASHFQVEAESGALYFVADPDFEAPADADHDNVYEVVVRASDGSLFDDQAFLIKVSDVAEQAPVARFGAEFLVNTSTEGHQYQPAIAGFSNGRFVAAWADGGQAGGDTSGDAVRVQVFNADGSKSGNELLANAKTAGSQDEPALATLSDGRFVVAWTDYDTNDGDGAASEVRAQIFNLDGTKSGAEFLLSASSFGHQFLPVITGLADGRFIAAWTDDSGVGPDDNEGIRAQVFNADGTKSGSEFQANTATNGSQQEPAITVLTNGRFVVTWADTSGTAGDQSTAIRARVFDPDGTPAGNEFLVNTTTDDQQYEPTITALSDGRFVAAWSDVSQRDDDADGTALRAQIFNADGTKSGGEFLVNTTTASGQSAPAVTALVEGRFVVAWTDSSATGDDVSGQAIRAQVFNGDGTKSGGEFVVNTTTDFMQFDPTIAALADGRFVVSWADGSAAADDASGLAIRGQIFDPREAAVDLLGTAGGDDFIGTGFDDFMIGGLGDDHLDGGAGTDTAKFGQSHDQYAVHVLPDGTLTVSGPDGIDVLTGFERLQFTDVTLEAGNLHDPQIISDGGGDTATLFVAEHQTEVTVVSAVDADENPVITYAITGGADASAFVIDPSSGVLTFAQAPDVAAPADADHDNSYVVQVRASDGVLTDTQTITVNVTGLSEQPETIWLTGTPGDDTFAALPGNERIDALGGIDTAILNFKLTEAVVTWSGNQVIIDGPASHTVLTGFEHYVFNDGTVDNNDGSPLIDDLFYYARNHDVWNARVDADEHYHVFGWHEGRDPSAFFSASIYRALNQDVAAAQVDPLAHFADFGWREGRIPSFAFDGDAYLAANADVAQAQVDPLRHFLEFGAQEGREPFALTELIGANGFDSVWYLQHNPDVVAAQVDPLVHFNVFGWREGRNPNALFDTEGYLAAYADVALAGVNPLDHYDQFGWREGRDPSAAFDTKEYIGHYADVAAAQVNPLTHVLAFGIHEGRLPFADGVWG